MLPIIVGGTIAIDNVKTPEAEAQNLLGGSAAYAALAASYFTQPVHLVGIIGKDYPQEHLDMLESHQITLTGVEHSEKDSFTWTGEYHENMNDRTTHSVALNVLEDWTVQIPADIADTPIVVLANMSPDNQLQMVDACQNSDALVIADSMDLWIQIANERLNEVLTRIDIFVINDSEAKEFCGTSNLVKAGAMLLEKGPKYAIIKLGEFGAMLFGPDGQHFRLPAYPLPEVADPTGAGDSFLGGLAGYLAENDLQNPSFDDVKQGIVKGTILASYTCEAFSTLSLQALNLKKISNRLECFKNVTSF